MLTRNFERLQSEVADHVAADRVTQGSYKTCFIGCLANGQDDPGFIQRTYGVPVMVTRIAESIFEGLRSNEAVDFFAAIPPAIASDGKDLSRVGWTFLATELRALPPVPDDIQACMGSVIEGMDLLGEGKEWPEAEAWANHAADYATDTDTDYATDTVHAAAAAADACSAIDAARWAYTVAVDAAAAHATLADADADAADWDTWSAFAARATLAAAARLRQRDTLLRLIKEAPITQKEDS